MKSLNILMVAAEAFPYAKTGGLADVVGALSAALADLGAKVALVMPFYRQVDPGRSWFRSTGLSVKVTMGRRKPTAKLWHHQPREGVDVYLLKCDRYFDREGLYGTNEGDYPDNAERFFFFSRAALEAVRAVGFRADVVHCHDWHAGLVPAYLSTLYRRVSLFRKTATLFTVHNLGYQGLFPSTDWPLTSLPSSLFTPQGLEFYGKINCMKAGLVFADLLNTVSRGYAKEIQTPALGFGLDGVLRERAGDLHGIMNGIDVEEWNPARDPHIPKPYEASDLSGKTVCKQALQREMGLPVDGDTPLLCNITRLTDQKGVDLIAEAFDATMGLGVQFVLLGSGEKKYEQLFLDLGAKYPRQARVRIMYDTSLAHRIEAGGDIFLMPSRYEPCGLNQMMSLRYGTVPLVRATGGLNDSVREFSPGRRTGNGFKFAAYDSEALSKKIRESIGLFPKRSLWHSLMRNGMKGDYSWDHSAKKYLELYRLALKKRSG
jgi:starch synthase